VKRPYDRSFHPPAPAFEATVHAPDGRSRTIRAKLDTAADVSGLPRDLVDELALPPARRVTTSTFRGEPVQARLHRGDLVVAGRRFAQVEWLPIGRPYALLGRDVLNDLVLRLDGPSLVTEVLRSRRP